MTSQAMMALHELDHGARFNCLHTVARELIEAGMAFDDFGRLEITEQGRRKLRGLGRYQQFEVLGDQVANVGDMNQVRLAPTLEVTNAPEQTDNSVNVHDEKSLTSLTWSRSRAMKAAGVANGVAGVWVEARWVEAFLSAYESD